RHATTKNCKKCLTEGESGCGDDRRARRGDYERTWRTSYAFRCALKSLIADGRFWGHGDAIVLSKGFSFCSDHSFVCDHLLDRCHRSPRSLALGCSQIWDQGRGL